MATELPCHPVLTPSLARVMWTDIDYMDHRLVFTLDEGNFPVERMQQVIKYIHDRQQRYIMMVDPAVGRTDYHAYQRGVDMDVFMKREDGSEFLGVVWPVSNRHTAQSIGRLAKSYDRASPFSPTGFIPTELHIGSKCSRRCLIPSTESTLMESGKNSKLTGDKPHALVKGDAMVGAN